MATRLPSSPSPSPRSAIRTWLALAAVLLIAAGSHTGVAQQDGSGDTYYYKDQVVRLRKSPNETVVRFRESANTAARARFGQRVRSGRPAREVRAGGRVFSVITAEATAATPLTQALDSLSQSAQTSGDVDFVSPVFYHPETGTELLPTDEIVVKLHPNETIGGLADLFSSLGLTLTGPMPDTRDEFVLQLTSGTGADALDKARLLYEAGRFEWAEPNFIQQMRKFDTPNDPQFAQQWHLNNTGQSGGLAGADVKAPAAWNTEPGSSNIVVAIVDDGIDKTHEDLASSIFVNTGEIAGNGIDDDANGYIDDVSGWDFSNGDNDPSPFSAEDNHGTAVAGVAAARGNNGIGVTGACRNCRLLPVKIFSPSYAGDTATASAIRYAAKFADVINNSWGGGAPSSILQSAIQDAITTGRGGKGAVVLFAAGNSASGYGQYSLTGIPAGTHTYRFEYAKDASVASGDDKAWLGWVQLPSKPLSTFESGGLPAGWTTGGNATWSVVTDPSHADEGACYTHAARSGTITDNQSSYLQVTSTTTGGTLAVWRWVSSQSGFDGFRVKLDLSNDGSLPFTADFTGSLQSGVPSVVSGVSYPAAYPESIAVGASTNYDCRSYYSQYGPQIAFVAPSNGGPLNAGILTTDRMGASGYNASSNYYTGFGGTSSATPLSAGVAALILSRNPTLTRAQVLQILKDSADKVGPEPYVSGRNDRYGYGRVNASAALAATPSTVATLTSFTPAVASPVVVNTPVTWTATAVGGTGLRSYKFWVSDGLSWSVGQDWSSASTFVWTPTVPGTYSFQVWLRNGSSDATYDAYLGAGPFIVNSPPPLTVTGFTPNGGTSIAVNTPVTWTAAATGGTGPYTYQFWISDGASWSIGQAYSSSNTFAWTPAATGTYSFQVWVRNAGSSATFDAYMGAGPVTVTGPPPPTVTSFTSNAGASVAVNTPVTWTAAASGGVGPYTYQFWMSDGVSWSIGKAYSSSNTFVWTPTVTGTYSFQVWVRNAGSGAAYDAALGAAPVNVTGPPPLAVTSFASNAGASVAVNTPVTWTGSATGGTGPYTYQFWVSDGASWSIGKAYSSSNTFAWTPTTTGTYSFQVWVRNAGSSATFDAYMGAGPVTVTGPPPPTVTSFTSNAGTSVAINTPVTWTAAASGGAAPLSYQFWVSDGASWTIGKPYSTSNTFAWQPTATGTYSFQVWVRNAGSGATYDAYMGAGPITVTGPPPPTVTSFLSNPGGPSVSVNTPVTWTAAATGGAAPLSYQFWVSDGASWTIGKPYSTSNTFAWQPTATGTYSFVVWVRNAGSGATYDAYMGAAPITVTGPPPPTVTSFSSNAGSTVSVGTPVTWTAAASGGSAPYTYQFWVSNGVSWSIGQAYSSSDTFVWTPSVPGMYSFQVWVRNAGSGAAYDNYLAAGPVTVP